uniref:Gem-associated protein 5-like isoform X3 n=1 Tax=Diabrotica virgifera virgifera TaxID=50390 RepID=A0A6P7G133_DIAVI
MDYQTFLGDNPEYPMFDPDYSYSFLSHFTNFTMIMEEMNPVTVPPSPNWFEEKIIACAPDNTLIYGSRNDLIIIEQNKDTEQAANVRIISRAHAQRVLSVSINRNWGPSKKFAASSDDKIVKLWNLETDKKLESHDKHASDNRIVGITFAGDDRVISVSDDGNIVIWNIINNETKVLHKGLFGMKVSISCISTCPHANWLTAFGLKSGLVIVADLRKDGKLLHKMRAHDKPIISLAWCPVPINIFPKSPQNYVGQNKKEKPELEEVVDKGEKTEELSPVATSHPLLKVYDSGDEDFLKECQILKDKILGSRENIIDKVESEEAEVSSDQLHRIIDTSILEKNLDPQQKLDYQSTSEEPHSFEPIDHPELDKNHDSTKCGSTLNAVPTGSESESIESTITKVESQENKREYDKELDTVPAKPDDQSNNLDEQKSCEINKNTELLVSDTLKAAPTESSNESTINEPESQENKSESKTELNMASNKNDLTEHDVELTEPTLKAPPTESSNESNINEPESQENKSESKTKLDMASNKHDLTEHDVELTEPTLKSPPTESSNESTINEPESQENKSESKTKLDMASNKHDLTEHDVELTEPTLKSPPTESSNESTINEPESQENKSESKTELDMASNKHDLTEHDVELTEPTLKSPPTESSNESTINEPESQENKSESKTELDMASNKHDLTERDVELNEPKNDIQNDDSVLQNDKDLETKLNDHVDDSGNGAYAEMNIVTATSVEEAPQKEFLLASSAKESNIYIWRAGTDGRLQTFLMLPHKAKKYKSKGQLEKMWISLCWITPTVLLSSSKDAELLAWNLPKPKDDSKLMKVIHKEHSALLFSMVAAPILLNEYNWQDGPMATNVWTTAQDRLLINTDITNKTVISWYSTLGGHVNVVHVSPVDPHRLAIGTADGYVKIMDLSRPHIKHLCMTPFYQRIQSRVTALAWHPTNESILAFGTGEGRVGYIDPTNTSKSTCIAKPYFKSQIYNIQWAPIKGDKKKLGLYVVSEGQMALYDPSSSQHELVPLLKTNSTFLYSISWLPDYSMLFYIAKDGHIIAYTPKLKVLCKHYFKYRLLEIVWHPNAMDEDGTVEDTASVNKYKNWFAAIANYHTVVVYKFDIESGNNDENIVNIYRGESDLINAISWNPFGSSQLVISWDIGIFQIWDVEAGAITATFENANYEPVTVAIFSPINPDYVISGGKDNSIRIWRISDHPPKDEKGILYKRKKLYKMKEQAEKKESSHSLSKDEDVQVSPNKFLKEARNYLLPKFYGGKNIKAITDLRKIFRWKENQETEGPDEIRKINDVLNIFGTDDAMINLVRENEIMHQKKGKYDYISTLSLFRGDLSTTIQEAIDARRVTPQIIALAPMVSPKLWQTACESYATQLSENKEADPLEIAIYHLACHKVEEALAVLCEGGLFREAVALAKCRMMGKDIIDNVIEKWAVQMRFDGNFEIAAQCYIYLGRYEDAASLLYRRTDLHVLEFLVELTEKIDNEELRKAVIYRYNSFKQAQEEITEYEPTEQELRELLTRGDILLQKQSEQAATDTSDVKCDQDRKNDDAGTDFPQIQEHSSSTEDNVKDEATNNLEATVEVKTISDTNENAYQIDKKNIESSENKMEASEDIPESIKEQKTDDSKGEPRGNAEYIQNELKTEDTLKSDEIKDNIKIKKAERED